MRRVLDAADLEFAQDGVRLAEASLEDTENSRSVLLEIDSVSVP